MTALAAPDLPGTMTQSIVLSIPSPDQGVWHLGPVPLRAYALCIVAGIFAGYWLGRKRWVARGGDPEIISDIVMWAVPFGLVGSRIYHVLTDYELYFGDGRDPLDALKIWHGGLGIWGGVAFGALGGWIACRRHKVSFLAVADVLAPGIILAQAIGRWGNYFNQELFGKPTTLPWALQIDPDHRPEGYTQFATFHPTFLYEFLWSLGVLALLLWADRRFTLGHGRLFALYVAGYTAGRVWIEMMRIDTVNHIAGLRLNVWTSIILFVASVAFFIYSARRWPGRGPLTLEPDTKTDPDAAKPDKSESDTDKPAEESDKPATDTSDTSDTNAEADAETKAEADAETKAETTAKAAATPSPTDAADSTPSPTPADDSARPVTSADDSAPSVTEADGSARVVSAGDDAADVSASADGQVEGERTDERTR